MGNNKKDNLLNKAISLRDSGELSKALAILSTIVEKTPDLETLYLIGDICWDMGQILEAISYFKKATQLSPDDELSSLALYHTLSESENFEEALNEMERYLTSFSSLEYESFRAECYFKQGMRSFDFNKRNLLLERAIAVAPEYAEAFVELGKSYKKLGEIEKAKSAYKKAIEIEDDGWARLYLGNLFYGIGDLPAAEIEFIKAQKLLPDIAAPLWCQGDVYRLKGEVKKSEQFYQKAVKLESNDSQSLARLGRSLLENNRIEEGGKYIEHALRVDPSCSIALKSKQRFM